MSEDARGKALALLEMCAMVQRFIAYATRHYVADAREAGATWTEIGTALGMVRETAFRQYRSGSPIVVIRPHQQVLDIQDTMDV